MTQHKYIKIEEDYRLYSKQHFSLPKQYEDSIDQIIIPHGLIIDRIERMARDIHKSWVGDSMTILCVLKGGFRFCEDLVRFLKIINKNSSDKTVQIDVAFLRMRSHKENKLIGEAEILGDNCLNELTGENVLIVEDVVDSGITMEKLLYTLEKYKPNYVKVASLLLKRRLDLTGFKPDFTGFELPKKFFVIGYGLDYSKKYFRDLDHICVINELGKKKYAPKGSH